MVIAKMSIDDDDVKIMDCYKDFLKMGYSEEDSKMLANLAVNSAVSYNGVLDIMEASDSLIRAMNNFDIKQLKV